MKIRLEIHPALALGIFLLASPLAYAQSGRVRPTPNLPGDTDKDTLRLRAEEVLLPVSIRSDRGKLPTRLEPADFTITEDDNRQEITSLMRTPANILLILDTSGYVTTLKNANINRELALKLVESLGEQDRAAVITYAEKVELLSSWTNDKAALREALDSRFKLAPRSRLYESLLYAAEKVLPGAAGRRCVVLLTDGVDSFVREAFEKVLPAMHRARATVYVVSHGSMLIRALTPKVSKPPPWWTRLDSVAQKQWLLLRDYVRDVEAGKEPLRKLAEETGGAVWDPEERIDCAKTLRLPTAEFGTPKAPDLSVDCELIRNQIVEEIGSEYVVAYSSRRRIDDSAFHKIRIYTKRIDLKVRTRSGLYGVPLPGGLPAPLGIRM